MRGLQEQCPCAKQKLVCTCKGTNPKQLGQEYRPTNPRQIKTWVRNIPSYTADVHNIVTAQTDRPTGRQQSQDCDTPTLSDTCCTVSWGKQPRAMDCLMMEKAALIMAWLATHAAAVAKTNTNCTPQRACQDLCVRAKKRLHLLAMT